MLRFLGRRGSFSKIERNGDELTVEWKIPNFFTLSAKGSDYYKSFGFYFSDARWCLEIHPNRDTRNKLTGYVDLFLRREDEGSPMTMNYRLSIIGEEEIEPRGEYEYTFSKDDESYGSFEFLSRVVLMKHQSILIPDGVLTVRCIMKKVVCSPVRSFSSYEDTARQTDGVIEESSACTCGSKSLNKQDASIQTDGDLRETETLSHSSAKQETSTQTDNYLETEVPIQAQQSAEKQGSEKLHEDFAKLLATSEDSDVTVQVGDVKFQAHRAILSARCPVLSAMFRHETKEKATNSVKIDDCEPDVFRDFLQYLYTGSVQSLTELNVFGLYRIADKYLADDLKQHCLELIRSTICVQTFCSTVQLALTHGESGLLEEAIAFATENIRSIIRSVEWQNFSLDYHTEANEILIKSLGPPS